MVTNPSQTDLPTPPGSLHRFGRRFGVRRNVIERVAGTTGKQKRAVRAA
jgi:hypothetical protein